MERTEEKDIEPSSIADIEARHPREYLAIRVTRVNEHDFPLEGVVLAHSLDADEVSRFARNPKNKGPIFLERSLVGTTPMSRAVEFNAMTKLMRS